MTKCSLGGRLPSAVIPLARSAAFLLLYEHTISLIANILSGHAEQQSLDLYELCTPSSRQTFEQHREASNTWATWTTFTRTPVAMNDEVVLITDTGNLWSLQTNKLTNSSFKHIGSTGTTIDTASAGLRTLGNQELLVLGGNASPGKIYDVRLLERMHYY